MLQRSHSIHSIKSKKNLMENGKDMTPQPFYSIYKQMNSSMHLHSSRNLSRTSLKSGKLSKKWNHSGKNSLFRTLEDLMPCVDTVESSDVPLELEEALVATELTKSLNTITLSQSPLIVLVDLQEYPCELARKALYSKMVQLEYMESGKQSQYEVEALTIMKSEENLIEEGYESDTTSATETESVVSSHMSLSTIKSVRKLDPYTIFEKIVKKNHLQLQYKLDSFYSLCFTKSYSSTIDLWFNPGKSTQIDIKIWTSIKQLKGECSKVVFDPINGLLCSIINVNSSCSYFMMYNMSSIIGNTKPFKTLTFNCALAQCEFDTSNCIIYLGAHCGAIFAIGFDEELQNCDIIFDSRLLLDSELHGLTCMAFQYIKSAPVLVMSNLKGHLNAFKVNKRLTSSTIATCSDNHYCTHFCTFKDKLVVLLNDGTVSLISNAFNGQKITSTHPNTPVCISMLCNSVYLGLLTVDGFSYTQDLVVYKSINPSLGIKDSIIDFQFHPINNYCALISKRGKLFLYDLDATNEPKDSYFLPDRSLICVDFTPNGQLVIVGDKEGTITIFTINK